MTTMVSQVILRYPSVDWSAPDALDALDAAPDAQVRRGRRDGARPERSRCRAAVKSRTHCGVDGAPKTRATLTTRGHFASQSNRCQVVPLTST